MASKIIIPQMWWAEKLDSLLKILGSSKNGISAESARDRLTIFGPNELVKKQSLSLVGRMLSKVANPLIILLLVAGLLSALLGQVSDFLIIFVITLLSVALDTYQEHSAELAAEKLKKSVALTASVIYNGVKKEVIFSHIVPGDVVFLSTGDIVPADGRLLSSEHLMIDQSTLTGESYPQHKRFEDAVPASAQVSERVNCAFMGTHVVSGEGLLLVVATSSDSELGKIAKSLVGARGKTEFEKGIGQYGYLLMKLMFILGPLVFAAHVVAAHNILESLLFVLALAVGFAPELLPLIVTINLSKGAIRMSKKGVIVKYLPAIENFGSMDVLCTDKTGTLTENAIKLVLSEDVDGKDSKEPLEYGYLISSFQSSMDNPIETAILEKGKHTTVTKGYQKFFELPFDFYRKRMSVILHHAAKTILLTKGAPESIIENCHLSEPAKKKLHARLSELASDGFRVIAVAIKDIDSKKIYHTSEESDLTFIGLLAFLDPPKQMVKPSLALLEKSGVTIKILTGDSELVTQKVCQELSLPISGVLLGSDIDLLNDDALARVVDKTSIFARLTPESKKRVIVALRAQGHVVGYLGDGVNDAPSLRASDIGISVNNAVDVAKESADIILLHKDLHVLGDGVLEGRRTFANVMKYIKMGTSSNFGNMISVAVSSLFLPFLPMLPVQILFNDLLYDMSQLFLASDTVDPEVIAKPRKWNMVAIRRFMLLFGLISSLFDGITFMFLLWFFRATPALFQTGWFLESIVTQTLIIFSIRTALVPFYRSKPSVIFALGLFGVVALALLVPFLPFGRLFYFVLPPLRFYVLLAAIVVSYILIVESAKKWFYARFEM